MPFSSSHLRMLMGLVTSFCLLNPFFVIFFLLAWYLSMTFQYFTAKLQHAAWNFFWTWSSFVKVTWLQSLKMGIQHNFLVCSIKKEVIKLWKITFICIILVLVSWLKAIFEVFTGGVQHKLWLAKNDQKSKYVNQDNSKGL